MSREIKFRAWDNNSKSFIEDDEYLIGLNGKFYRMDFYSGIENYEDGNLIWNELDNITLSQFTGLLDKNGKEIFEGDILIFYIRVDADIDDAGQVYKCKGQVIFDNGAFIIQNIEPKVRPFFYYDWDKMKIGEHCEELSVGGNIYLHPELLGGENE